MYQKRSLPNATATLVLGILSLLSCFCYGFPGMLFAGIALAISVKPMKMYKAEPDLYSDYGNLRAGRIMAIIGLVLSLLFIITLISLIAIFGYNPEALEEYLQDMQRQQSY